MNRFLLKIQLVGMLLLLVSCSEDEVNPIERATMRLFSMGSSPSSNKTTEDKAVLLFWELDKFKDISQNRPFLVSKPSEQINSYTVTPYDTHVFYPPKDNIVASVGYSPQNLVSSQQGAKDDYLTLTLPKGSSGATTDLLTSANPVYGSTSNPFDQPGQEPLKFMHAQSKVTFKAKLKEGITLGIRNIRIEIGKKALTGSLVWDQTKERFVTKVQEGNGVAHVNQKDTKTALTTTPVEIGAVYVLAGLNKIPLKITVEKWDDSSFSNFIETTISEKFPYTIKRSQAEIDNNLKNNHLYAGEAYTFTLTFDQSELSLIGRKEPWEDGGTIPIPIVPNEIKP